MTDIEFGLNSGEVRELTEKGQINGNFTVPTKSVKRIVFDNVFTFFNLLNVILAIMVIMVGSYKNCLFMGVIFSNIAIGIFQEVRAKRTIDRLTLISAPKAKLLRNGKVNEYPTSDVVLGDIMILEAGMQICADGTVVSGECEVNESLITGESDPVVKKSGDSILSGSFIVCGSIKAEAVKVGADSYANKITSGAKYIKKTNSEMMRSINLIIKAVAICIIPIGIFLFCKAFFINHQEISTGVTTTVAALIGMIPEGLVLLTSIVLAVSVIRLSLHKTLVQDMYCIETLARVDTLCLDKTGTITEGSMQVDEVKVIEDGFDIDGAMNDLMTALTDTNPTSDAMHEKWKGSGKNPTCVYPFSSAKKWSGARFEDISYVVGAGEFVLGGDFEKIRAEVEEYAQKGQRVLTLAYSENNFKEKDLPEKLHIAAMIIISDKIRKEAPSTLAFFAQQNVDIKIISGDNPITVSKIAQRAGVNDFEKYIDASTVVNIGECVDKYKIFGRVTPAQKLELVKALQAKGHTVGMTGDGVNDVLALKEADCSIAMQSGSDAARNVSNLVLLDSNFASMPKVVAEGRRSINNIERSASLFLTKTIYSFLLAVLFMAVPMAYPFQPIQMTLINAVSIGIPSFLLALEPNTNLVSGYFIENVMKKALPYALTVTLSVVATMIVSSCLSMDAKQFSTFASVTTAAAAIVVLYRISCPLNKRRCALFIGLCAFFTGAILLFPTFFEITNLTVPMLITCGAIFASSVLFSFILYKAFLPLVERTAKWIYKRKK